MPHEPQYAKNNPADPDTWQPHPGVWPHPNVRPPVKAYAETDDDYQARVLWRDERAWLENSIAELKAQLAASQTASDTYRALVQRMVDVIHTMLDRADYVPEPLAQAHDLAIEFGITPADGSGDMNNRGGNNREDPTTGATTGDTR